MKRISLDTEATGVDLYHGAKPFLVTICNEQWENTYWEWDVDPKTRQPKIPTQDLEEIAHEIETCDELILQNPKFDVTALAQTEFSKLMPEWPWHKTKDTLLAAHLLASNHAKDLNSLAVEYLAIDISKYEDELEVAVKECRKLVKNLTQPHTTIRGKHNKSKTVIPGEPAWRIAAKGLPEMPSCKEKTWKYDLWLPRAVAKRKLPGWKREWLSLCANYANSDSTVTLAVYQKQLELIEQRGLMPLYEVRLQLLPIIYEMERYGVTYSATRLEELRQQYTEDSAKCERLCLNIANDYGYELTLPKSGANNSLREFVFDVLKLEPVRNNKKKKTSAPDLDKQALEHYLDTLPPKSKSRLFVENLRNKRKRDTALAYMEGYEKFGLKAETNKNGWIVLHPSLNPTGTDTLRFSSSNPNEQNISKQEGFNLRYIFGPAPGREWWSMDAANIELRIPAYEAGEEEMIALFEKPNEPPYYGSQHALNFSIVYPDLWSKILDEVGIEIVGKTCKERYKSTWYQYCKNGGFAVQYGSIEESGTADRAFHRPGSFAKIKSKFEKIHGPTGLNQQMIKQAQEKGYVETMPDYSIGGIGYPLLCTRSSYGRILPTVPLNYHTQGTACWWMIKAMIRCHPYLQELTVETGIPHFMVMQVHDELVFDLPYKPNQGNLGIVRNLAKLMEKGGEDIKVPVPVKAEYHESNWSEGVYAILN